MALDVAEFLWTKFMSSLQEADSDLSGSTFMPYFTEIINVVKAIVVVPKPNAYSASIHMLYELNDALAECRIFIRQCKKRNKKLLPFNPVTLIFTHNMKNRLTKIKEDLQKLAEELSNSGGRANNIVMPLNSAAEGPILSAKVFGFDEYTQQIAGLLFEGGSGFRGIGVVGIAGMGKTTLVQKFLESQRVKDEFNPTIWLPFSGTRKEEQHEQHEQPSKFNFETSIHDSLGNLLEKKIVGLDKLLERLNQLVSGKRYLIVLDDVCHHTIKIAERLWHGLPKARGGAVIVTCKVTEVAKKLVEQKNLVTLEPLDGETCWFIFKENVNKDEEFSSNASYGERLEKMKKDITDQCHGLPLAAKTLAEVIPERICQMRSYY